MSKFDIPEELLQHVADILSQESRLVGIHIQNHGRSIEIARQGIHVELVSGALLEQDPTVILQTLSKGWGLLLLGAVSTPHLDNIDAGALLMVIDNPLDRHTLFFALDGLLDRVALRRDEDKRNKLVSRYQYELGEIIEISKAITQERDLDNLLGLILEKSRFITGADSGSIYVLEGRGNDISQQRLHFKLSQNDSLYFESSEFEMPVSERSIAGAAVLNRKPINIADVNALDPSAMYSHDSSYDKRSGYQTRTMLTMPLISAQDVVIGVIQLINKKRNPKRKLKQPEDFEDQVVPFDERSEELLSTLASQAGITLENALLYDEIQRIFEGFVRASVQAIEQRDPTTSGHSQRVSILSCRLAECVNQQAQGKFKNVLFNRRDMQELQYASLLHDFGKIGVRENVLVKSKKLYPFEKEAIHMRIDLAIKAAEIEFQKKKIELMNKGAGLSDLAQLDNEFALTKANLMDAWELISKANEPTVLEEGDFSRLSEIAQISYQDLDGIIKTLLNEKEVVALKVIRGSLTPDEFDEIRSHVVHTFNFLERIPWGNSMQLVPEIAGAHHERLDGSGYPRGIKSDQILLQSKIISVADIYDALTAQDRPYKKSLPVEKALQILDFEVKDFHVDEELVRIFREAEVFKTVEKKTID